MTTDALLNIAVTVILPFLMALGGGILAAKSLQSEVEKRFWIAGFIGVFLLCVSLSFVQQVRNTTQEQARENRDNQKDLTNTGNEKYMQGQLDSINKVLVTLSSNSNPNQTVAILKSLIPEMPQIIAPGQSALEKMSNKQLRSSVLSFVSRLRDSVSKYNRQQQDSMNQYQTELAQQPRTDTTNQTAFLQMTQREMALSNQFQTDYKSSFAADASSYRDELIRRLGPQPPRSGTFNVPLSVDGWIVPMSVDATATYLEELAKKFPQ